MQFTFIEIILPNGKVKTFPYNSFNCFASTNELEHNEENIIITLDDLTQSFIYETDELSGEIINKEHIGVLLHT